MYSLMVNQWRSTSAAQKPGALTTVIPLYRCRRHGRKHTGKQKGTGVFSGQPWRFLPAKSFPVALLSCCSPWLVKHAWKTCSSDGVEGLPAAHASECMATPSLRLRPHSSRARGREGTPSDIFLATGLGCSFHPQLQPQQYPTP